MQSVKWMSFGISNALTRTVVHFFPSEGGVTGPYPASCALRIFGKGVQEKRIVIEGARLSHPDGVRVEDAFPALKSDQVGLFGLEIEVSTIQPRVDIGASSCVVELASKGHSAKFWPKKLEIIVSSTAIVTSKFSQKKLYDPKTTDAEHPEDQVDTAPATPPVARVFPILKDSFNSTSVVVVNGTTDVFRAPVTMLELARDGSERFESDLSIGSVAAANTSETTLGDETSAKANLFSELTPQSCSWGLFRARTLISRDTTTTDPRAVFVMYRDALTRRPVSVCSV